MSVDNIKRKILIVDDDEASRILINEILEDTYVVILEAANGREANELFDKHKSEIALVLLDIKLPGCTGWEVCQQLRYKNEGMPIVAMSAITPYELATKCKDTGFTTYLSKPFEVGNFMEMVGTYL